MKTAIRTTAELLEVLNRAFPSYVYDDADTSPITYHGILQDFIVYFGANNGTFRERQLRELADIINAAVEAGGELENAFGTCFLEHLDQIRARKPLVQFLSGAAKRRLHV